MKRSVAWILVAASASTVVLAGPSSQQKNRDDSDLALKSSSNQRVLEHFQKSCGHALQVSIDWKSFPAEDTIWKAFGAPVNYGDLCIAEIVDALDLFCSSDDLKTFRPAVAKVESLVCVYKSCSSLPPVATNKGAPPKWDYALSKDDKTVTKYLCETAGQGGSHDDARVWIKKAF